MVQNISLLFSSRHCSVLPLNYVPGQGAEHISFTRALRDTLIRGALQAFPKEGALGCSLTGQIEEITSPLTWSPQFR